MLTASQARDMAENSTHCEEITKSALEEIAEAAKKGRLNKELFVDDVYDGESVSEELRALGYKTTLNKAPGFDVSIYVSW